jgi:putative phage-related membrane protein
MGGLILRLFSGFLGFVFKGIVAKFFVFFALFFITTEFIPVVIELFIPENLRVNFQTLFNNLPSDMWYFLELLKVPFGVTLFIYAMLARFIIRRIPVIG